MGEQTMGDTNVGDARDTNVGERFKYSDETGNDSILIEGCPVYNRQWVYITTYESEHTPTKRKMLNVYTLQHFNWSVSCKMIEAAVAADDTAFLRDFQTMWPKTFFTREGVQRAIEDNNIRAIEIYAKYGISEGLGLTSFGHISLNNNTTPIQLAVQLNSVEIVKILVEYCGYYPGLELVSGERNLTPLGLACYLGHVNVVNVLLARGANPNTINGVDRGCQLACTALHLTVTGLPRDGSEWDAERRLVIMKLLIEHGANTLIKNWRGDTVADQLTTKFPAKSTMRVKGLELLGAWGPWLKGWYSKLPL